MTSTPSAGGDSPVGQRPAILDRVSFVVAGAQKRGTSTLEAYLREHPELCLPTRDEIAELERLLGWDCWAWLK